MKKIAQSLHSWIKLGIVSVRGRVYPISLSACGLIIILLLLSSINSNSVDQVETYDAFAIQSIIEQSQRQYSDLRAEHIKLQTEYAFMEVALSTAKQNADNINALLQNLSQSSDASANQAANLREQALQLQSELANIRVVLQVATDERATFEQRFLKSQYENTLLADRLIQEELNYQILLDRIAEVSKRTDITTSSNLTPEKRTQFYEMWDIWVETLFEEVE